MNIYFMLAVVPRLAAINLVILVILFISIAMALIARASGEPIEDDRKPFFWFIFSLLIFIAIPDKKEMIQIYAINAIKNVQGIDKLPTNLVHRLNKLLEVNDE